MNLNINKHESIFYLYVDLLKNKNLKQILSITIIFIMLSSTQMAYAVQSDNDKCNLEFNIEDENSKIQPAVEIWKFDLACLNIANDVIFRTDSPALKILFTVEHLEYLEKRFGTVHVYIDVTDTTGYNYEDIIIISDVREGEKNEHSPEIIPITKPGIHNIKITMKSPNPSDDKHIFYEGQFKFKAEFEEKYLEDKMERAWNANIVKINQDIPSDNIVVISFDKDVVEEVIIKNGIDPIHKEDNTYGQILVQSQDDEFNHFEMEVNLNENQSFLAPQSNLIIPLAFALTPEGEDFLKKYGIVLTQIDSNHICDYKDCINMDTDLPSTVLIVGVISALIVITILYYVIQRKLGDYELEASGFMKSDIEDSPMEIVK